MLIKIKVTASAKHNSLEKTPKGIDISVKAKAENNMANDSVREILAIHFDVPINKIKIVRGHKTSSKTIEVMD